MTYFVFYAVIVTNPSFYVSVCLHFLCTNVRALVYLVVVVAWVYILLVKLKIYSGSDSWFSSMGKHKGIIYGIKFIMTMMSVCCSEGL